MVVDLVSHFTRSYFDHDRKLNGLNSLYVEIMTSPSFVYTYFKERKGSRRVKIGLVSKIDEILLYNVCMSSVTENDLF